MQPSNLKDLYFEENFQDVGGRSHVTYHGFHYGLGPSPFEREYLNESSKGITLFTLLISQITDPSPTPLKALNKKILRTIEMPDLK